MPYRLWLRYCYRPTQKKLESSSQQTAYLHKVERKTLHNISYLLFGKTRRPKLPNHFVHCEYSIEQGLRHRLDRPMRSMTLIASIAMVLPFGWWLGSSSASYSTLPGELPVASVNLTVPTVDTAIIPASIPSKPVSQSPPPSAVEKTPTWLHLRMMANETLADVFSEQGLNLSQLQQILKIKPYAEELTTLYPDQRLHIKPDANGNIEVLILGLDFINDLYIERRGDTFNAEIKQRTIQTKVTTAHGIINASLLIAGREVGLSGEAMARLVNLFEGQIKVLNIRYGDYFSVVYEKLTCDGEQQAGDILAAEFFHQGKVYRAVRYANPLTNDTDYYTPNGERLPLVEEISENSIDYPTIDLSEVPPTPALDTPVNFTRISSLFGMRHHPILHKRRFHRGIDFAAPVGTPVRAPANAAIKFFGEKGGYGKTIILQHDEHHDTLYAHLSDYANDLFVGQLIQKGQVIGYVGQSGLSTGPHLHYELHIDEVYQNPLPATTLPPGTLIVDNDVPSEGTGNELPMDKAHFLNQTRDLIARLDSIEHKNTQVARVYQPLNQQSKEIR